MIICKGERLSCEQLPKAAIDYICKETSLYFSGSYLQKGHSLALKNTSLWVFFPQLKKHVGFISVSLGRCGVVFLAYSSLAKSYNLSKIILVQRKSFIKYRYSCVG